MTGTATLASVGDELVSLCRQRAYGEAIDRLYAADVVTVEPCDERLEGIEAVRKKNAWWMENFEVHRSDVFGPWPHHDRFAVRFQSEVTHRPTQRRLSLDEVAIYTVRDGKIARVEFFYHEEA